MARGKHHKGPVLESGGASRKGWATPKKKWVYERHLLSLSLFVSGGSENGSPSVPRETRAELLAAAGPLGGGQCGTVGDTQESEPVGQGFGLSFPGMWLWASH